MAIYAFLNNKGGLGKTICSISLAAALAAKDKSKRVLLIDNDPQSNASSLLLGDTTVQRTLYNLYIENMRGENPDIASCIYPTLHGVDVLPNSNDTGNIEFDLYQDTANYKLLRNMVRKHAMANYDFVFIDCPPTLGLWAVSALICADAVIVPVEAGSRMSIDGLESVIRAVEKIAQRTNKDLKFLRALINKVDARTSAAKLIIETINRRYPGQVFSTTIPMNTAVQQAEIMRMPVVKFDPHCSASKKFRALADELLEIEAEAAHG